MNNLEWAKELKIGQSVAINLGGNYRHRKNIWNRGQLFKITETQISVIIAGVVYRFRIDNGTCIGYADAFFPPSVKQITGQKQVGGT